MKTYDGLFIFLDAMNDDAVAEAVKKIRAEMEKLGGAILETIMLGRRAFSRPLRKKEAGFYVQVVFQLEPGRVAELRGRFRLRDEIFRTQLTVMKDKELAMLRKRIADAAEKPAGS